MGTLKENRLENLQHFQHSWMRSQSNGSLHVSTTLNDDVTTSITTLILKNKNAIVLVLIRFEKRYWRNLG